MGTILAQLHEQARFLTLPLSPALAEPCGTAGRDKNTF